MYDPTKPATKVPNLRGIACAALVEQQGDTSRSAHALLGVVRAEYPEYYAEIVDKQMLYWAQQTVISSRHCLKNKIEGIAGRQAIAHQPLTAGSLQAAARAWTLYEFPVGGVLLGNATRAHLREFVEREQLAMATQARRCAFVDLVSNSLRDDTVAVRDVLTLNQLEALAKNAGLLTEQGV